MCEPVVGAHQSPVCLILDTLAAEHGALRRLRHVGTDVLGDRRYEKFRRIGAHVELVHDSAAR